MRVISPLAVIALLLVTIPPAWGQRTSRGKPGSADAGLVTRMMRFDADQDGTLSRDELTDDRLMPIFDRADADGDGSVTRVELTRFASRGGASLQGSGRGDRRGPGGPGDGPPGDGPGPGMRGSRPKPGEVLPQMLQQRLKLTAEQQAQVKELQNDVDERLAKILTSDQKAQLKEMVNRRPPGGPGSGPPPDGFGDGPGEGGGPPPPPDF